MLKVEVARGAEKSRRAAPRRWTVSGEGEGERHLEAARARLVVLREAARAELELAADLGILRDARSRESSATPREAVSWLLAVAAASGLAAAPLEPSWRARAAPYPDGYSIEKAIKQMRCGRQEANRRFAPTDCNGKRGRRQLFE